MPQWEDETYRLEQEVRKAIEDAGGSTQGFAIAEIARFLYACQCNSIEIWRVYPDGQPGKLHVNYNPEMRKNDF